MRKLFFKHVWCRLFGHAKKVIRMPLWESWFYRLEGDESGKRASLGSLHCASCGTMVGDYRT